MNDSDRGSVKYPADAGRTWARKGGVQLAVLRAPLGERLGMYHLPFVLGVSLDALDKPARVHAFYYAPETRRGQTKG